LQVGAGRVRGDEQRRREGGAVHAKRRVAHRRLRLLQFDACFTSPV
jgi:hypothetical protein